MASLGYQFVTLLLLAIPIACVAWTVTQEEVFREPREYCKRQSENCRNALARKFFYLFTCEYCFSHYVAAGFLFFAKFQMLYPDWRGYVVAWFSLVWVANQYMSLFRRLRLDIKREKKEIEHVEAVVEKIKPEKAA